MAKASPTGLVRPSLLWFLLLDGGIIVMIKLVLSQTAYDRLNELSGEKLPPRATVRAMLAGTAVIHLAEALVAGRLAKRRGMAPGGWRIQTLVVGFPSLLALRKVSRG
jgi:transmembrane protein TMEM254